MRSLVLCFPTFADLRLRFADSVKLQSVAAKSVGLKVLVLSCVLLFNSTCLQAFFLQPIQQPESLAEQVQTQEPNSNTQLKAATNFDDPEELRAWEEKYGITEERKGLYPYVRGVVNCSGVIRNADGDPVAGAQVHLRTPYSPGKYSVTTVSDENGRYQFSNFETPPLYVAGGRLALFATKEGRGFAYQKFSLNPDPLEIDLTLPGASTFAGVVKDDEGDPIEGVEIGILKIISASEAMQYTTSSVSNEELPFDADREFKTVSDSQGRFMFENLGPATVLILKLQHPKFLFKTQRVTNADRSMLRKLRSIYKPSIYKPNSELLDSDTNEIEMKYGNQIVTKVVIDESNESVANQHVVVIAKQGGSTHGGSARYRAEMTDDLGFFKRNHIEFNKVMVKVVPSHETKCAPGYHFAFFNPPLYRKQEFEIRLRRGELIAGTVKDEQGTPCQGYTVWLKSKQDRIPTEFEPYTGLSCVTDAEGRFEKYVEPGRWNVVAHDKSYLLDPYSSLVPNGWPSQKQNRRGDNSQVSVDVEIVKNQRLDPVELIFPTQIRFASQLVDENGEPVANAKVKLVGGEKQLNSSRVRLNKHFSAVSDRNGEFSIPGLPSDCGAVFELRQRQQKRMALFRINSNADVPAQLELPLGNVITGRTLLNGKPIAGVSIGFVDSQLNKNSKRSTQPFQYSTIPIKTFSDGRYELLVPASKVDGDEAKLTARLNIDRVEESHSFSTKFKNNQAKRSFPDIEFGELTESISGRVLDASGNGLGNAHISFSSSPREKLVEGFKFKYDEAKINQEPILTDELGNFTIESLPKNATVKVSAIYPPHPFSLRAMSAEDIRKLRDKKIYRSLDSPGAFVANRHARKRTKVETRSGEKNVELVLDVKKE